MHTVCNGKTEDASGSAETLQREHRSAAAGGGGRGWRGGGGRSRRRPVRARVPKHVVEGAVEKVRALRRRQPLYEGRQCLEAQVGGRLVYQIAE